MKNLSPRSRPRKRCNYEVAEDLRAMAVKDQNEIVHGRHK